MAVKLRRSHDGGCEYEANYPIPQAEKHMRTEIGELVVLGFQHLQAWVLWQIRKPSQVWKQNRGRCHYYRDSTICV